MATNSGEHDPFPCSFAQEMQLLQADVATVTASLRDIQAAADTASMSEAQLQSATHEMNKVVRLLTTRMQNFEIWLRNRERMRRATLPLLLLKANDGNGDPWQLCPPDGAPPAGQYPTGNIGDAFPGEIQVDGLEHEDIFSLVFFYNDTMRITKDDDIVVRRARVLFWLLGML
ncbi:hypothetical protein BDW22DRAFT_1351938 [Trametopsis cervina]|nr:hypothetical protein BDW22DRAFT_1351938 [Trametopsis cervina]